MLSELAGHCPPQSDTGLNTGGMLGVDANGVDSKWRGIVGGTAASRAMTAANRCLSDADLNSYVLGFRPPNPVDEGVWLTRSLNGAPGTRSTTSSPADTPIVTSATASLGMTTSSLDWPESRARNSFTWPNDSLNNAVYRVFFIALFT